MKEKVFIFDLDDTIINTDQVFWDLAYVITGKKNTLNTFMDTMKCWENMEFFPSALQFLLKIYVAKMPVKYVTARGNNVRGQTEYCFRNARVADDSTGDIYKMHVPNKDELLMSDGPFCKEVNLKRVIEQYRKDYGDDCEIYMFDDHPKYLDEAVVLGVDHVFTFDNNYVKSCEQLDKVEVFADQEECFKTMIKRVFG
jgi:ribonucleotide monophosphatase NagD (HAD superfamily)